MTLAVQLVSEFRRGDGNKLSAFVQFSKLALSIRHELIDLTENPAALTRVFPVKGVRSSEASSINSEAAHPYFAHRHSVGVDHGRARTDRHAV